MGRTACARVFYGIAYEPGETTEEQQEAADNDFDRGAEFGCGFNRRGHYDLSEPVVYIKESLVEVAWADVAELDSSRGYPWDALDWKLKDYCAALGLPYRQPKWLLTAYYG